MADNSDLGQRVLVAGQGGKSTLARAIAADLGLPFIELDSIYWLPGWVQREPGDFRAVVQQTIYEHPDGWVIDGNYGGHLKGLVAKQAETVVYVNMPWRLLMWRTFWRSVNRARTKRVLWSGNSESWRQVFLSRDSLLCFLIRNRRNIMGRRAGLLRGWAAGARMIELDGARALDEFYEERGLVRCG